MASPYPENSLDDMKEESGMDGVDGLMSFIGKAMPCVSGKHVEVPESDLDDTTYNFSHRHRGQAIIISNEDFSKARAKSLPFKDREESSVDAESLSTSFTSLGFTVKRYNNRSKTDMVKVLGTAASDQNNPDSDCFACAIMTHGGLEPLGTDRITYEVLYGCDGEPIATKTIMEMFSDRHCPTLKDKPRIFFLQACRGDEVDPGHPVRDENHGREDGRDAKDSKQDEDSMPQEVDQPKSLSGSVDPAQSRTSDSTDALEDVERKIPLTPGPLVTNKDFLVMFASPPHHYAWKRTSGSWLMQSLCEFMDPELLESISLQRVLTKVCAEVAFKYESYVKKRDPQGNEMKDSQGNIIEDPRMSRKKQAPNIISTLVKDVFIRSKGKAATP